MKVETKLFAFISTFFLAEFLIYGFWAQKTYGNFWHEPVGDVAFLLSSGLGAMIGGFTWWTGRKIDPRPDDDPLGEQSDVEGDYGFFSPHSWWPLYTAGSGAIVFLGLAVGWWLVILGIPLLALSAIGWVFEYFHGDNSI